MTERFRNGKICVVKSHILSDKSDRHGMAAVLYPLEHLGPLGHIRLGRVYSELAADDLREMILLEHDGAS